MSVDEKILEEIIKASLVNGNCPVREYLCTLVKNRTAVHHYRLACNKVAVF